MREGLEVVRGARVDIHQAVRESWPDGDLVHVDGRDLEEVSALGHREHRHGIRQRLGAERRAFDGVDRKVQYHARRRAGAEALTDIEDGRLAFLALAHDHHAFDREAGDLAVHGGGRGLVGGGLIAPAPPARGGDGGCFGNANDVERKRAVEFSPCRSV